jgi:hypothetical protein
LKQYTDAAVSLAKFNEELAEYRALADTYLARGWFLIDATFPEVFVVMAATKLRPAAIVTGVLLDYTNYDAEPPSLRLVNPFTRVPLTLGELSPPARLNRAVPGPPIAFPGMPGANLQMQALQPLMQAHAEDEIPFLCIAGVREYHDHPGHSGDRWELHRASGAGRLVRLLEVVHRYGVEPIQDYSVQLTPQVGLAFGEAPA